MKALLAALLRPVRAAARLVALCLAILGTWG